MIPAPPASATMRFRLRVSIALIMLSLTCLQIWRVTRTPPSHPTAGTKKQPQRTSITSDTFLHVQQLRKEKLRNFCHQFPELKRQKTSETAEHLLSTLAVSPKLSMVYCKSSDLAVDDWDEMIGILEARAEVTIRSPVVGNDSSVTVPSKLADYDLATLKHVLQTFTKVLFVRDPFERLVSAYIEGQAEEDAFHDFIDEALLQEVGDNGLSSRSVVVLCHPCFVKYDYIVMYDFLNVEVEHLIQRLGLPGQTELRSSGARPKLTLRWMEENLFRALSGQLIERLAEAYWCDFAAFPLYNSLLWNHSRALMSS